jgi:hypothetical protein
MKEHSILQKLMLTRQMTEGTKRAVRERLMIFLEAEEKAFIRWIEVTRQKLNATRAAQVERRFNKEIQALKIVIHKLTPFGDRVDDEPSIIVKKQKPAK